MDYYNDIKQNEQIFVSDLENEIFFNGPVNYISMSNLIKELLKLESKIIKDSTKLKRKLSDLQQFASIIQFFFSKNKYNKFLILN